MTIHIPFLTAGLNGDDGLIRQHWAKAKKVKETIILVMKSQKPKDYVMPKTVVIIYRRYGALMDWDNCGASFKHLGDGLVKAGFITDDKPKVVTELKLEQIPSKEKRIEIEILSKF